MVARGWGREAGSGRKEELQKYRKKLWGMMDVFVTLIVMKFHEHVYMSNLIKFLILSVCILLYVSYILVKLFLKARLNISLQTKGKNRQHDEN